ncbi:MAG: chromosome segregation protein SMC [Candidatus Aenigmarchaeota archaeon]|nr:chromosome segregation protein SMC [Candidatus Aenigmarchaeota archaeon]
MVRIEKIVCEGFKSFKRKVSVPFTYGFSVVTGPNGSGKTNIADAIYFVIGSGTRRSLRAKKSHELIFQGNDKKQASDYAKVIMHLDNSSKTLPIKDEKVTVSRRVNKAGVSTYRLGGRIATKQEVMDLLAQAGITADGHNLIQQGDVTRIVEMGPVERRRIIDEIAGITEYDEKKDKALKELGKVEEKVREAEILLEQKDELLKKIKAERDTALDYKRMQNSLRLIVATNAYKNLNNLVKKLESAEKGSGEKEGEIGALSKQIKDTEKKISGMEAEMEAITGKVLKVSSRMEEANRLNELQTRLGMKRERIKMNQREIERISELIERLSTLDKREGPAVKAVLGRNGVSGTFSELVMVPPQYKTAVEVAAGGHLGDVVVDRHTNAVECINYLKANKIGRVRFLPLDKIAPRPKQDLPRGAIGWLSDLVHHDPKYSGIVNYVLGSTMCVNDIEKARDLMKGEARHRMVTLDGDLVEKSGAMTGGFYRKGGSGGTNIKQFLDSRKGLEDENETLNLDIQQLNNELEAIKGRGEELESVTKLEEKRVLISKEVERLREERDALYDSRGSLQEESGRLSVRQAKYEANLDTAKLDWQKYQDMEKEIKASEFMEQPVTVLEERKQQLLRMMDEIGPVNMKAIQEFDSFKDEFETFKTKVDKIIEEKTSIENTITGIEKKKRDVFNICLEKISKHFKSIYNELTQGDADLRLDSIGDMDSGLQIYASPPGKHLLNIDSMSTGEKTLTAFAFLFAIQNHKPAPFYILDEADAALDKANTKRVAELVKKHSKIAQFIIISHNDQLIKEADQVYGVSMEDGESKVIGIQLPNN